MHRAAATMDGRFDIVAGSVSADPERSRGEASNLGVDPDRAYGDASEMLRAESARPDGAEVIAIMTPNDSHHAYAMEALDLGFDVICDKPMTNTVDEALDIVAKVKATGLVFCLTHNYTGYPMVRQARAMVEHGQLGEIRLVQVEYVQGNKADENDPDPSDGLPWRFDPVRGGPSLVMGDIGTHAHNLARFITGLEVSEVAAEIGHVAPGRLVDDFGAAMLRFNNGARGSMWVTQAAAGVENALRIRVSGTRGTVEWHQESPTQLIFRPLDGPVQMYKPNGPGILPEASRSSRIVAGHPEGFQEAFANVYSDAAEAIAARRSGGVADPLALDFPTEIDGAVGVRFVDAVVSSSSAGGAWTNAELVIEGRG
jgi:predicted dehydrogenase